MSLLKLVIRVTERSQRTCNLKYDGYMRSVTQVRQQTAANIGKNDGSALRWCARQQKIHNV